MGVAPRHKACYESLTASRDPYLRAEGFWGLEMYDQANNEFRTAVAQSDTNAMYRVRWGMLLHERFNNTDADDLFKEALQTRSEERAGLSGAGDRERGRLRQQSHRLGRQGAGADPKLVEAHELLANFLWKIPTPTKPSKQADEALKISPEALDAMAIHAAVELLADRSPDEWLAKVKRSIPPTAKGTPRLGTIWCSTVATRTASPITARRSSSIRSCGPRAPNWASI